MVRTDHHIFAARPAPEAVLLRRALIIVGWATIAFSSANDLREILTLIDTYQQATREHISILDGSVTNPMDDYGLGRIAIQGIVAQTSYLLSSVAIGLLCIYAAHTLKPRHSIELEDVGEREND